VFKTKYKTIERLVHVDAYRLKKAVSLTAIGLDDFMNDPKTLVLIEWADKFISLLPNKKNSLRFKHAALGRIISLPAFLKIPSKPATPRRRQSANRQG
jgi:tRNA A37 threonylcarbamoyladenosine biosynthesis protein TsaE